MRQRIVNGEMVTITENDHNSYAREGNISYAANGITQEVGKSDGVSYGEPTFKALNRLKSKRFLYLIFYIDENHKGKLMISESAQTRLKNIKKQNWYDGNIHQAFCVPLQSVDEIIEQMKRIQIKHNTDKVESYVKEVGFFSHSGGDGPISYNTNNKICPGDYQSQMAMCGWKKINALWAVNAKCIFYGCNTSNTSPEWNNFAKNISKLSNFKDVQVWGQPTSSFPSFYPDYRVTSLARSVGDNGVGWDLRAHSYQVAGNEGQGSKALSYRVNKATLSKTLLASSGYPKANLLNSYINGKRTRTSHQGVFNDHR